MNYAEMSLVTKMAGSVESVNTMLLSMLAGARTAQELELASLQVSEHDAAEHVGGSADCAGAGACFTSGE
jgi:Zn-dependent oligopeptidase